MARKAGQIIARGLSTWLIRVYLGRDPQTGQRKYLNQTIHGPFREAQLFLHLKLQQRDNGRVSRASVKRRRLTLSHLPRGLKIPTLCRNDPPENRRRRLEATSARWRQMLIQPWASHISCTKVPFSTRF